MRTKAYFCTELRAVLVYPLGGQNLSISQLPFVIEQLIALAEA